MDACDWELIRKRFDSVDESIKAVLTKLNKMEATIMTQLDDLNTKLAAQGTAIDNIGTALTTLSTDNAKALADLKAAIAAAQGSGTLPDISAQLQALDANNAKLATIASNVASLDAADIAADPTAVTTPPASA